MHVKSRDPLFIVKSIVFKNILFECTRSCFNTWVSCVLTYQVCGHKTYVSGKTVKEVEQTHQ